MQSVPSLQIRFWPIAVQYPAQPVCQRFLAASAIDEACQRLESKRAKRPPLIGPLEASPDAQFLYYHAMGYLLVRVARYRQITSPLRLHHLMHEMLL